MDTAQARELIDTAIAQHTDPYQIARLEIAREYFCNEEFRRLFTDTIYRQLTNRFDPHGAIYDGICKANGWNRVILYPIEQARANRLSSAFLRGHRFVCQLIHDDPCYQSLWTVHASGKTAKEAYKKAHRKLRQRQRILWHARRVCPASS